MWQFPLNGENFCCKKSSCVANLIMNTFGICIDYQVLKVAILNHSDIYRQTKSITLQQATGKVYTGNLYCEHMGM